MQVFFISYVIVMHKFSKNKEDAIDLEASTDEEDMDLKNPSSIAKIVRNAKKRKIAEKTILFKKENSMETSISTHISPKIHCSELTSQELELRLSNAVTHSHHGTFLITHRKKWHKI